VSRSRVLSIVALLAAACGSKAPFGDACEAGTTRCDRNSYQQCADDGNSWRTIEECAPLGRQCVANQGCLVCSPSTRSCGGDGFDIVLCRHDGTALDVIARCEPENGDVCASGACRNACSVAEETRSYEGCDYWAVDLDNAVVSELGAAAAQQFSVVVTNPLEVPATVTVEVNDAPPGEEPQLRVVATEHLARVRGGGDLAVINLPAREVDGSTDPRLNDGPGTFLSSNAYHIKSTAPIVAYQFNPLENVNVFSNDASLLLPTRSLDRDYAVLSWPQTLAVTNVGETNGGIHLRAFLTIVGVEPFTQVSVTTSTTTIPGPGIPAAQPGDTLTYTLGPHDVLNLETGGFNADFTGSRVITSRPVAVFTGSEASDVPFFTSFARRDCCADHLEEQLFPTAAFGSEFVAVKTPLRTRYVRDAGMNVGLVSDEPEYWRVLAVSDDTQVTTSLLPPNNQFNLSSGDFVTFASERDFVVESSKPISFGQYPASQQTTGIPTTVDGVRAPGGDPSSIQVPPIGQWRDKYVFLEPNKYAFDFLLIAMPATSNLLFDGEPLTTALPRCEFKAAGAVHVDRAAQTTEFVAVRCPLSDPIVSDILNPIYQNDGRHVLESSDGQKFGLIVYGWDSYVSYGYPGGTDVRAINLENQ
jgi:hypothetical protein